MDRSSQQFVVIDYIVFGCMLLLSSGIGLFYAIKDRKQQNTEEYLLAGRSMSPYPVAFSLCVSFLSAVTVLGTPAEVYRYGIMYIWVLFGCAVAFAITAQVFLPIYYKCGLSSVNQYLERRFHRGIRIFATVIYLFQTVLYVGVVILAPALTLNAVMGVSLWGAALLTGVICILYSSLGGLKAVLWTDTLQMIIMLMGLLSVIIKASVDSGGFSALWNKAYEAERLRVFKFDLDPRIRHSTWSVAIGSCFFNLSLYAANPALVQRYLSCRSLKGAKLAIFLNYIGMFILLSLAVLSGVVMYGYYHNCDPLSLELVKKPAQLIPYMAVQLFKETPGMPGLFVAAVYSGSLSTVSTAVTAMASVTVQDLLKPFISCSEPTFTWISRGMIIFYGSLCMFSAFAASQLGGILQLAISVLSLAGAPLLVVFTLGVLFPFANKWGALSGMCGATCATVWIFFGKIVYPVPNQFQQVLPLSTVDCIRAEPIQRGESTTELLETLNVTNTWENATTTIQSTVLSRHLLADLYAMSYMYLTAFGFIIGMCIGVIVSLFTGGWQSRNLINRHLICPIFTRSEKKAQSTKNDFAGKNDETKTKLTEEFDEDESITHHQIT